MNPRQLIVLIALLCSLMAADAASTGYFNDFEKTPPGKPPDDILILNGQFAVKEEAGNHFLEVGPDPADGFGILFGPEGLALADVKATIFATSTGRRFPEFGIGCGDAGGLKLFLAPGERELQIRKADDIIARVPFTTWTSGQWMSFHLQLTQPSPGKWRVVGKAWLSAEKEPAAVAISCDLDEAPPTGRASAWASPYSGSPIRFDDLSVK